jgi:hypothetical protein
VGSIPTADYCSLRIGVYPYTHTTLEPPYKDGSDCLIKANVLKKCCESRFSFPTVEVCMTLCMCGTMIVWPKHHVWHPGAMSTYVQNYSSTVLRPYMYSSTHCSVHPRSHGSDRVPSHHSHRARWMEPPQIDFFMIKKFIGPPDAARR